MLTFRHLGKRYQGVQHLADPLLHLITEMDILALIVLFVIRTACTDLGRHGQRVQPPHHYPELGQRIGVPHTAARTV